jgi:hypothetical protein
MKNLKDLEKHIKEVEEKEDEIGEISVTGGGEAYDTPYAFKKKKKKKDESVYKQIASSLYLNEKNLDPVGKEDDDIDNDGDSDESDEYLRNRRKVISKAIKKQDESVNEAKYKDYKKDESMSSAKKINLAIREVNRKLFEIERILDQSYRLKTEDGVGKTAYTEKTKRNLYKISEKMYRISEKLRKY